MKHDFKILVPIGFSEQSLIALEQAFNIAKVIQAEVDILYVIEESGYLTKFFESKNKERALKKSIQDELDILITNGELKYGLEVRSVIAKGKVYEKILEYSDTLRTDLIVMGKNGHQGTVVSNLIGSNALKVISMSNCPVITVKPDDVSATCKNILLPLDLTKQTTQKISYCLKFASYFKASVKVVSVCVTDDQSVFERLKLQMNEVIEDIRKKGFDANGEVLYQPEKSSIIEPIVDYGKSKGCDLIMIMTQQEAEITRLFIGSQAMGLINISTIPVLSMVPQVELNN